ncbi:MAG: hypothetical protein KA158_10305 [Leucobacter sp.]|nr:hypothetical protein [Leucobacter sp.]
MNSQKGRGVIPGQLSSLHKTKVVESPRARFPLTLLLQAELQPSSYLSTA